MVSNMLKPTVGPIVGHTTTDHCRIFLRGDYANNLAFAAIRHRRQGDTTWSKGRFIQLKAHRDMSDVIVLNGLQADTLYEYQAGWFSLSNPTHTAQTIEKLPLQWPHATYCLRTQASETDTPRAYIVGSCRYLRITGGVPLFPGLGDRTFAGINSLVAKANPPVSAIMMMGDQVYLDDLNIVAPDRTCKSILFKYRTAFTQPHISKLMSGVPTYMILDDHEIEDNWPANKAVDDDVLYANAMQGYELYQASHGPAHQLLNDGALDKTLKRYWYRFSHGDIEWFVTDSRTQRNLTAKDRRILDEEQEHALLQWLINSQARVKLIVTSVLFYPDSKHDGADAWQAFADQRLRILETLRNHGVKNVFFVTGDIHGSMTCRLRHSQDLDFEVNTIVSSPFCNSKLLPYAKAADFIFDAPIARTPSGEYLSELTSKVVGQDNFARLYITAQSLQVTFHDRDGRTLQTVNIALH
jgi:alkaline phosphatase D